MFGKIKSSVIIKNSLRLNRYNISEPMKGMVIVMQDHINCSLGLPYPDICAEKPDKDTALLLYIPYSGRDSELTAISSYLYQSIVLCKEYPEAATILECIAETEMLHFRILGKLIFKLGTDPKLFYPSGRQMKWWSGGLADYSSDLSTVLKNDLEDETKAAKSYAALADKISDKCVSKVLRRISLDEDYHARILFELLNKNK